MPEIDSRITLLTPGGTPLDVASVSVTETVNGGWTWEANLNEPVPMDTWSEADTWDLTLEACGDTLHLPPLVAVDYEDGVVGGGGGRIAGMDQVMHRLQFVDHTFSGNRNTTSSTVLGDMAWLGNFAISNQTLGNFPILEMETASGTNLLAHLLRLLDVIGAEFRVLPDLSGGLPTLQLYELEYMPVPNESVGAQPDWTTVRRSKAFMDRPTVLRIVKTSRMTDALNVPYDVAADSVYPIGFAGGMHSAMATVPGVTLWNGDPTAGGTQVGTGRLAYDEGTVTHVKAERDIAGGFVVRGTQNSLIPAGVELAFSYVYDSGVFPYRLAEPWEEILLPNLAYATARAQLYLWRRVRHIHRLTWEGPPALGLRVADRLIWPNQPQSRVESVTHTLGGGQASTSAESAVLGPAIWGEDWSSQWA